MIEIIQTAALVVLAVSVLLLAITGLRTAKRLDRLERDRSHC